MTQPAPVTINVPPNANGAVQIIVVQAGAVQETQRAIGSMGGKLGAVDEGGGGIAPASIPAQSNSTIALAADPSCRCQISQPIVPKSFASRTRLRLAMKWAPRFIAVLEGYSAIRESIVPVAMAAAATLHFV